MILGIPKESRPDERRVAIVPASIPALTKRGLDVRVQSGAGTAAGYPDDAYAKEGAHLVPERRDVVSEADIVLQVNGLGTNPKEGRIDLEWIHEGQTLIALMDPLGDREPLELLAKTGARVFALELMPRITRAQSMDVLSAMATIAGYKAVLLAAAELPRMFPMLMTAAGTINPAHVLVVGAGVAGLQACATAKRLGAVVQAYDVRPAVKEQVESVGARFLELSLETKDAEGSGGYAQEQSESFVAKQRELMAHAVEHSDVVITTAAIPGKPSPLLVTTSMVEAMAEGSVIVDLAAERGGNCELTEADAEVEHRGVRILGPLNLPATIPFHASQMLSKNITTFLSHMMDDEGRLRVDLDDAITRETLVIEGGAIVHERLGGAGRERADGGKSGS